MGKRLDQALAEANEMEAADAVADVEPAEPLQTDVKVSRPNRSRSKVLQVRLNPDEFEALERIAERRELPVSTVAREQLLYLIASEGTSASNSMAFSAPGTAVPPGAPNTGYSVAIGPSGVQFPEDIATFMDQMNRQIEVMQVNASLLAELMEKLTERQSEHS
jgi:hypothetical protein